MWRLVAYAFFLLIAVGAFRYHDEITGIWELFEGGVRTCDSIDAIDFNGAFDLIVDPNDPSTCLLGPGTDGDNGFTMLGATLEIAELPTQVVRKDIANTLAAAQTFQVSNTYAENDIIPNDFAVTVEPVFFCGQLGNSTTHWFRPAEPHFWGSTLDSESDIGFGTTYCDAGDSTSANNDALLIEDSTYKFTGMVCRASADAGGSGTTCTLLVNDVATTPSINCTMGATARSCTSTTATTTDVTAGQTTAVKCQTTADMSAQDMICKAYVAWQ